MNKLMIICMLFSFSLLSKVHLYPSKNSTASIRVIADTLNECEHKLTELELMFQSKNTVIQKIKECKRHDRTFNGKITVFKY